MLSHQKQEGDGCSLARVGIGSALAVKHTLTSRHCFRGKRTGVDIGVAASSTK